MLPTSFSPDTLRTIGLVVLVVLLLGTFLVLRFVQRMVLKVVLVGLFVGLGVFVWWERADLHDCVKTCACSVAGLDVQVPDCPTGR